MSAPTGNHGESVRSPTSLVLTMPDLCLMTRALHSDRLGGPEHGATHQPLHLSAGFSYARAQDLVDVFQGTRSGHVYSRQGNPTTTALEAKLNLLEEAVGTVTFATGMAAITATMLALLKAGDHVIASQYLFGNTASWLGTLQRIGCEISFVDATSAQALEQAMRTTTRMVFIETIANPCTQVADLEEIGALCRHRGVLYVVDSTMTTPVLFQAKDVGASLVVHSLSKSICGHGNALGGSVSDTGLFDWSHYDNILDIYKKGASKGWGILQIRKKGLRDLGSTLSAEHAHRISAGLETLELRMDRACQNALRLAQWLSATTSVAAVYYPGLTSHAGHLRASHLFKGFGALLSFELQPGRNPVEMLDRLKLVIKSSHLGDNRTLGLPPAQTIFWEMGAEMRRKMGIADSLVRISVGIERFDDLVADFAQALA